MTDDPRRYCYQALAGKPFSNLILIRRTRAQNRKKIHAFPGIFYGKREHFALDESLCLFVQLPLIWPWRCRTSLDTPAGHESNLI